MLSLQIFAMCIENYHPSFLMHFLYIFISQEMSIGKIATTVHFGGDLKGDMSILSYNGGHSKMSYFDRSITYDCLVDKAI